MKRLDLDQFSTLLIVNLDVLISAMTRLHCVLLNNYQNYLNRVPGDNLCCSQLIFDKKKTLIIDTLVVIIYLDQVTFKQLSQNKR